MKQPEKIGRYKIIRSLGRGGMAVVYLAHDPRTGRDVALKVLQRGRLTEEKTRARFAREARVVASLEHPAIVPLYDFGDQQGQPFLVMRHMSGGSLTDRIQTGPLSIHQASRVLSRIAAALDEAHKKGIVHRDLKPGNILFDQNGEAYLSDFGIVKVAEASTVFTVAGGIVGTPSYMSPEQVQGDAEIDGRSDIYSLGVVLYAMLLGRVPYRSNNPAKQMLMHLHEPVPHICDVDPSLPIVCDEIIARAMAKQREDRYAKAGDMAAAFAEIDTDAISGVQPSVDAFADKSTEVEASNDQVTVVQHSAAETVVGPIQPQPESRRRIPIWVWFLLGLIGMAAVVGLLFAGGLIPAPVLQPTETPTATATSTVTSTATVLPTATTLQAASATPTADVPASTPTAGATAPSTATVTNTPVDTSTAPPPSLTSTLLAATATSTAALPLGPFTLVSFENFPSCPGGTFRVDFNITLSGGTPPYTYSIDLVQIGGPISEMTFSHAELPVTSPFIGTFHIDDSADQRVSEQFFIPTPC